MFDNSLLHNHDVRDRFGNLLGREEPVSDGRFRFFVYLDGDAGFRFSTQAVNGRCDVTAERVNEQRLHGARLVCVRMRSECVLGAHHHNVTNYVQF